MDRQPSYTEHYISRGQGRIYARDYEGVGPALVLMHGFPDNLHIYDDLLPYLTASGRRVVAFDFLGFGASDKAVGATYSFSQQLGDLEAIVEALGLDRIVPVAHDASGPAAINFAIEHPEKVASLCILNAAYDDSSVVRWPEMIVLFATPSLSALAQAIPQNPEQFGWLLGWQRQKFNDSLPESQKSHFEQFLGPLIANNFVVQPSSGPAFMQMAAEFFAELSRNSKRLHLVRALDMPAKVIWGECDPYLNAAMAEDLASRFKNGSLHLLPAGHWLQSDMPKQVAEAILSGG